MTHWELVEGQMFRQRYHQCYCVQVRPNLCIIRTSNTHFTHLFILGILYFRCMKRTIYVIAAKTDPSGSVMCIMSIADFIVTLVAVSISLTFLWLLDKLRLSRLPTTSIHLLHCTSIVEHWCSLSAVRCWHCFHRFDYLLISHFLLNLQHTVVSSGFSSSQTSFLSSNRGQISSIYFADELHDNFGAPHRVGLRNHEVDNAHIEVRDLPQQEDVWRHFQVAWSSGEWCR